MPVTLKADYCSKECKDKTLGRKKNVVVDELKEYQRTKRLMELHDQLDRCATHWERTHIMALIEAT